MLSIGLIFGGMATVLAEEPPATPPAPAPATPAKDSDRDGIPDDEDNCPETANPTQYDGDEDGTGLVCDSNERNELIDKLADITNSMIESNENGNQQLNDHLDTLGFCIETDSPTIPSQCSDNNQNAKMRLLAEGLTNRQIVTILEEPIGNKNVYNRARICRTRFLKNKYGLLQPAKGQPIEINFEQIGIAENVSAGTTVISPEETLAEYRESLSDSNEYLISLDDCQEYFVDKCSIPNTPQNERYATLSEPLPIKVFCDRVQVLFASSGTGIIKNYVGLIYGWASGLIGLVAVLVIIFNGIMMSASNGDQGAVENARNRIMQSLTAITILFISGLLLYTINPNFFTDSDLQGPKEPTPAEKPADETPPE